MKRALRAGGRVLAPLAVFLGIALAPIATVVLLPAAALWFAFRRPEPAEVRQRRRRAALERLITVHLLAHGLDNTPANRARVLMEHRRASRITPAYYYNREDHWL